MKEAHMKGHHIFSPGIDAIQHDVQVIQGVVVSDHDQDISGTHAEALRSEIVASFEIELIELRVLSGLLFSSPFRDRENGKKDERKCHSRNGGDLLRQEIN